MRIPLAITGASLITAAGRGAESAWNALLEGRSCLALDREPELEGFSPIATARCGPLDPVALGVDRRSARLMDHHSHMLMAVVLDAFSEAEGEARFPGEETAFFAGMDSVDPRDADLMPAVDVSVEDPNGIDVSRFFGEGMGRIYPLWPLGMLNAIAFSHVAIRLGLRGDNAVFSPGPEAAARALAEGAQSIRHGCARGALVAGVSTVVSTRAVARYRERGLLQAKEGEALLPKPFGPGGGAALGEGAGAVFLEPAEASRARGDRPFGHLLGCGAATASGGEQDLRWAVCAAARAALRASAREPGQIGLLVPHGEGAEEPDAEEIGALADLLEGNRPQAMATKGAFGHLLGGSPTLDLVLALRAVSERIVPPSPAAGEEAEGVLRFAKRPEPLEGPPTALILCRGIEGECSAFVVESA